MKDKYLISVTHSLCHQVIHSSLPNALTSEIQACSLKKRRKLLNELLWFQSNKAKRIVGLTFLKRIFSIFRNYGNKTPRLEKEFR
jgi:hypothetical protein